MGRLLGDRLIGCARTDDAWTTRTRRHLAETIELRAPIVVPPHREILSDSRRERVTVRCMKTAESGDDLLTRLATGIDHLWKPLAGEACGVDGEFGHELKERVNKGGRSRARQDQKAREQQHDDDQRQQPELLGLAQEADDLGD